MTSCQVFCEKLFSVLPPPELIELLRSRAKESLESDDLAMISQITEVMQLLKDGLSKSLESEELTEEQEGPDRNGSDRNVENKSINAWFMDRYSIDLPSVWDQNKEFILDSLPSRFRCQDLYAPVTAILNDLGIPESDITDLRFGLRPSGGRGRFIPTVVARLASYGEKKNTNWWTRQEEDGIHYLVKLEQPPSLAVAGQGQPYRLHSVI
jgi:hypothetical protein